MEAGMGTAAEPEIVEPSAPAQVQEPESPPGADRVGEAERQAASVEAFAQAREGLEQENERDALDWLLGGAPPVPYGVPFTLDTPDGLMDAKWIVRAMDGRKLDAIEQRNISETTGQLDVITANCQLLAEASMGIEGRPGHVVDVNSEEFRTLKVLKAGDDEPTLHTFPSAADAIEARFRRQMGIVAGLSQQIRRLSGYDPDRVGKAQRRGAEQQRRAAIAVGNS